MRLTPTAIDPISINKDSLEDFLDFAPFSKYRLSTSREGTLGEFLKPYWEAKGADISRLRERQFFLNKNFDSQIRLQDATVYSLHGATLIPKLNHVLLSDNLTIMERFGSSADFLHNMEIYGSYFGYSKNTNRFEINLLNPHFSVFSTQSVDFNDDSCTPILLSNDDNDKCYTHWVMMKILEIFTLTPLIQQLKDPLLVFSYTPTPWQIQSIAYFFPFLRMRYLVANTVTRFRKLLFVKSPPEHWYHGEFLKFLYQSAKETSPAYSPRRFFISRNDAFGRRLVNHEDATEILHRFNFTVVELSRLNFADQAELFGAASSIVFTSGSSGMNLALSSPGTSVGLITNLEQPDVWSQCCHSFGISNVIHFGATPLDRANPNSDLSLDLHSFENFIISVVQNENMVTQR